MAKIVILYSGGLDSLIMSKIAEKEGHDITYVYYDIGQAYAEKEKNVLPPGTQINDMSWFSAKEYGKEGNACGNIMIPGRNLLFAVTAACQHMPDEIWMGALMGEIHPAATDKNLMFRDQLNLLLKYVLSPYKTETPKLVFPFVDRQMGKFEVAKWAVDNGYTNELLKSSSCMDHVEDRCGQCIVCLRRWGIFEQLGLYEKYTRHPMKALEKHADYIIAIIEDQISADSGIPDDRLHYDVYRRRELVPALEKYFGVDHVWKLLSVFKDIRNGSNDSSESSPFGHVS